MIERTVFLKLHAEHSNASAVGALAQQARQRLAQVPGIRGARVGLPADPKSAAAWDLVIVISLDSIDDVPAYLADPTHRRMVDTLLRPRVEVLKAWNFELPD